MKLYAYFQQSGDGVINVFVAGQPHVGGEDWWMAAVVQGTKNLFDGFRLALSEFNAGELSGVKLASYELTFLGEIIDGDVLIGHHNMFLVEADQPYWLANREGRMAKLGDLETILQSYLGTSACMLTPVGDSYIGAVVRNHAPIENLRPQVLMIMKDGSPVDVQLFGLPSSTLVTVVDVLHPQSVSYYQDESLLGLVYQNGIVENNVRNVTPSVDRLAKFSQVAKLI
ncbi:hypothetical protein [Pseudomonas sp. Irchel 3E13]|uniref:hypothetical protein n=1 Tax=Pseudomonas sp. Irchel 3E13 TaxID=2008975 RepID=UPI000BA44A96|nr:hypothetical protein [Pseudomonas sp. Irchel 3E13]